MKKILHHFFALLFLMNWGMYSLKAQDTWEAKIVGGKSVAIDSVPWQVFLYSPSAENFFDGQFCGGSIIDEFWVLTAAHCVVGLEENPEQLQVVAGLTNLNGDPADAQVLEVSQIIIHPNYQEFEGFSNDMALLRLAKPVVFSANAQPIAFATAAQATAGLTDEGVQALVSGWGNTSGESGDSAFPDSLQAVTTQIVSNTRANAANSYDGLISDEMLAAGNYEEGGKDACQGDSGGPLVVAAPQGNGWVLAGVTSWGFGCGEPLLPGIYARVSFFEEWIRDRTGIGLADPTKPETGLAIADVLRFRLRNGNASCPDGSAALTAKFVVRNEGNTPVDTASLQIRVTDADTLDEIIYRQPISFPDTLFSGESIVLEVPQATIPFLGEITASLIIETEPANADGRPENNLSSFALNLAQGLSAQVRLIFDRYPTETFWQIRDANTLEVVYHSNNGNPYDVSLSNDTLIEAFCLSEGNYVLLVGDSFGDGLEAEASVNLQMPVGGGFETVAQVSGNFGDEAQFSFDLPFQPEPSLQISPRFGKRLVCNETEGLPFQFINDGNVTVDSVKGFYHIGGDSARFSLEGLALGIGSAVNYTFPIVNLPSDTSFFYVQLDSLNGASYTATSDTVEIILPDLTFPLQFTFRTDGFPEESSWEMLDNDGVALRGQKRFTEFFETEIASFCLPEGTYILKIVDSFGDGSELDGSVGVLAYSEGDTLVNVEGGIEFDELELPFFILNPPVNPQVAELSPGEVQLSWDNQSTLATDFLVATLDNASRIVRVDTVRGSTSIVLTGFPLEETFQFRVSTLLEDFTSLPSETLALVTDLEDGQQAKIDVYPNPVSNWLNLSTAGAGRQKAVQKVALYSLTGLLLKAASYQNQKAQRQFSLRNVPDGVYLLRLYLWDGSQLHRKILVKP